MDNKILICIGTVMCLMLMSIPASVQAGDGELEFPIDPILPGFYDIELIPQTWPGEPTTYRNGYSVHFAATLDGADSEEAEITWIFRVTSDDGTLIEQYDYTQTYDNANGANGWWNWDTSTLGLPNGDYVLTVRASGYTDDGGLIIIDPGIGGGIINPIQPKLPNIRAGPESMDFHLGTPDMVIVFDKPFYLVGETISFHFENHGDAWGSLGSSSPSYLIYSEAEGWTVFWTIHTCDVRVLLPGERAPLVSELTWDQTFTLGTERCYENDLYEYENYGWEMPDYWNNWQSNGQQVPAGEYEIRKGEAIGTVLIVEDVDDYVDDISDIIDALPDEAFTNKNHDKALINKLNALQNMIDAENYQGAIDKINNDIIPKVDDWMTEEYAEEEAEIIQMLLDLVDYLETLL